MNPTSKKFISLFLFFSLMILPVNLYAKRRGAKLLITQKDGLSKEGELIVVKPNSLLLLDSGGKDLSVDIADIKVIQIVRKAKTWAGTGLGLLAGGILGSIQPSKLAGGWTSCPPSPGSGSGLSGSTIGWAILGGAIGGISGALAGVNKTIQFEGIPDLEKRKILDNLSKKARIRDYK